MPGQRYELHHRICNLRYGTHGYEMSAYKVFINIKNRTVCFQERFRLLSLAAVLRKYPS